MLRDVTDRDPAGVDYAQETFLGQGKQDNESAIEQAKDEQISDFIRAKYKSTTGKSILFHTVVARRDGADIG